MNPEDGTFPNQEQKLDQIFRVLNDFRQNVEARLTSLENRMAGSENRIASLETEVKQGFELLETRVMAVEIRIENLDSSINKAISVSREELSVVHGLRGETIAMRRESAYHGREITRLEDKINQAA